LSHFSKINEFNRLTVDIVYATKQNRDLFVKTSKQIPGFQNETDVGFVDEVTFNMEANENGILYGSIGIVLLNLVLVNVTI
jgi:hypothetical protein